VIQLNQCRLSDFKTRSLTTLLPGFLTNRVTTQDYLAHDKKRFNSDEYGERISETTEGYNHLLVDTPIQPQEFNSITDEDG